MFSFFLIEKVYSRHADHMRNSLRIAVGCAPRTNTIARTLVREAHPAFYWRKNVLSGRLARL